MTWNPLTNQFGAHTGSDMGPIAYTSSPYHAYICCRPYNKPDMCKWKGL